MTEIGVPQKRAHIPPPKTFSAPGQTRFRDEETGTLYRRAGSKYTPRLANLVCKRIMQGMSLKDACNDPRMPSWQTVTGWLANPNLPEFREQYYFARRVQAELLVDEIIGIADDASDDWKPVYNKDGELIDWKPDNEAIQRSRVRIDTRKWFAAKMVPRMYGDKVEHSLDVTGDLANLLKAASNNDSGLPPPIDVKAKEVG